QDEHGRPLQVIAPGIDAGAMPATIALCTDVGRQVVSGGEHRHHHPLGDRYVVHTGAVAEGHPCGNGIQEPIDPGGHGLDSAGIAIHGSSMAVNVSASDLPEPPDRFNAAAGFTLQTDSDYASGLAVQLST